MQKNVMALATGAALLGASTLGLAGAPEHRAPEARAYVNFTFGGAAHSAESFFYGLRLDHNSRLSEQALPPLMALEFDRGGFSSAKVNGMAFARDLRLNQDGSGETRWTMVDWGILALGVAGVGVVVSEVLGSEDESPDPAGGTTTGGVTTGGDTTGGGTTGGTCLPGTPLCLPTFTARDHSSPTARLLDLDGGTGYMGDLIAE